MSDQKNLVVLYYGDDWHKTVPLENSPETRASFEEFYTFANRHGWNIFRASILWFDQDTFSFLKSWTYADGTWQKIESSIRPDAVFDKTSGKYDYSLFDLKMAISKKISLRNSPLFRTSFDNKFSQYLTFSEFMPMTLLAESRDQLLETLSAIPTTKAVIKEIYGSGGKQVTIEEKNLLESRSDIFLYPVIIQEFIETSGIPGFSDEGVVADLRLVYINKDLVYALSRIAKQGSLHTNFHQGAHAVLVPLEKIPPSCLEVAEKIRRKLILFENINYSLDFMFTQNDTPLFIEMNTTPGLDLLRIVGAPETKEYYYQELLDSFLQKTI
ncbi:MAG: hypothetical protein GW815_01790 [Candidatus Moranbacteria bacterium]|nr:hypothetical protein [Candidatus Moranbacteria bacterium]OIQ02565.1 MAG: hypothetical protein AUK58_03050 [Candidatus Moranbacteria bacterium CG2_30_41_165]PIP25990.1 MAG: hypothetical protein COX32_00475 [Candidatus Moranbacteria bacterium CG23_combo_of_CG06-09_8_20_14_all_41_28]PIV86657.1 MAG: hypothetical protein COW50_00105 [Candidatus Moranbacteria bacterium CG17_big_fil_post_rev_8_21_14_2_50_41_107]PIW94241.1 MAG: hypothetical protein COZ86_02140 [Candidatus Moranbacteria bacterium CG_